MSDIEVKVKFRNARILRAIRAQGFKSIQDFVTANGLVPFQVRSLICMRRPPISRGDWTEAAFNLPSALHVEPEELWPDVVMQRGIMQPLTLEVESHILASSSDPLKRMIQEQVLSRIKRRLNPRERKLLIGHLRDGLTLTELAQDFGRSTERGRQILSKALRKLNCSERKQYIWDDRLKEYKTAYIPPRPAQNIKDAFDPKEDL